MAPPSSSLTRRFHEVMLRDYVGKIKSILVFAELRDSPEWCAFSKSSEILLLLPWDEIYISEDVRNLRWFVEFLRESVVVGHPLGQCILGIQKVFIPNEEEEGLSLLRFARDHGLSLADYGYGMYLFFDCLRNNNRIMTEYGTALRLMMQGKRVTGREVWSRERAIFMKALQVCSHFPNARGILSLLDRIPARLCHRSACRGLVSGVQEDRHYRIATDGVEVCSSTCCALLEAEKTFKEALISYARVDSPVSPGSDGDGSD